MSKNIAVDIRLMTREQQLARMTTDFAFIGISNDVNPASKTAILTSIAELANDLHKAT
jgi:hypothetical protein